MIWPGGHILVCGSRDTSFLGSYDTARHAVEVRLRACTEEGVIHGGAPGIDRIAENVACELGMKVREFPANWSGLGRKAGIIRNEQMLDTRPALVLAFWDGESRGTEHTIESARRRGLRLWVVRRPEIQDGE